MLYLLLPNLEAEYPELISEDSPTENRWAGDKHFVPKLRMRYHGEPS